MRGLLPLMCLLAACRGVTVHDVRDSFHDEYAAISLRLPARGDLSPARAYGVPMQRTERLARAYLASSMGGSMYGDYVRALLACTLLMQGETGAAAEVVDGIAPRDEWSLVSHENAVTRAVIQAVAACRSVEAREAVDAMLTRQVGVEEYIQRYGSYFGVYLPRRSAPDYQKALVQQTSLVRKMCFARVAGDPRAMERIAEGRTEVHRLLAEQVYNDTGALLVYVPEDGSAESEWLGFVATSLVLVNSRLFRELVPMNLPKPNQKHWQIEQVEPVFRRAEEIIERLERSGRHAVYGQLPALLRDARIRVRGWIETR